MQANGLHLTLATPTRVVVDGLAIVALRADDTSGSFGIRQGHADFVTLLDACVVQWRTEDGATHCCAVDGGVLRVSRGSQVAIACREAIPGESLASLEAQVHRARAALADADRRARVEQMRLHAQAVRQILRYLRPGATPAAGLPQRGERQP
jgi:F-type H+-transporting ATPase subunit epsilon